MACYSVCVSLGEGEESVNSHWSVQRKLTEFHMLHRKLTEVTRMENVCIHIVVPEGLKEAPGGGISVVTVTSQVVLCICSPQCFPSLKKLQLPSLSKLPFKSIDQKFLDKSKIQLNAFLQVNTSPDVTANISVFSARRTTF